MRWRSSALISAGLTRGGTVVVAFLIAIYSDPSAYAAVALLVALTPVVALVAPLGVDQWLFRHWARLGGTVAASRGELARPAVVSGIMSLALVPLASAAALLVTQDPLVFSIAAIAGGLQAGTVSVVYARFRAVQAARAMLLFSSAIAFATAGVRLAAVAVGAPAAVAWLMGDIATALVGLAVWVRLVIVSPRRAPDLTGHLRYGAPMAIHGLWQWLLGSSDRFIYGVILATSQVGLYGAVAQVSNGFNALASEVNKSGLHRYASEGYTSRARSRDMLVLGGIWLGLAPIALGALALLQARGYEGALTLGGALYASLLPLCVYLPVANEVSISAGRAGTLSVSSMLGCAVNILVNLSLVWEIALYAGPIANAAGYLTMTTVLLLFARVRGSKPELHRPHSRSSM